jgi:hypothetical protein
MRKSAGNGASLRSRPRRGPPKAQRIAMPFTRNGAGDRTRYNENEKKPTQKRVGRRTSAIEGNS